MTASYLFWQLLIGERSRRSYTHETVVGLVRLASLLYLRYWVLPINPYTTFHLASGHLLVVIISCRPLTCFRSVGALKNLTVQYRLPYAERHVHRKSETPCLQNSLQKSDALLTLHTISSSMIATLV